MIGVPQRTAAQQAQVPIPVPPVPPPPASAIVEPEPEIDEPLESSHAPMMSADAQDEDDWNERQNWNSRS